MYQGQSSCIFPVLLTRRLGAPPTRTDSTISVHPASPPPGFWRSTGPVLPYLSSTLRSVGRAYAAKSCLTLTSDGAQHYYQRSGLSLTLGYDMGRKNYLHLHDPEGICSIHPLASNSSFPTSTPLHHIIRIPAIFNTQLPNNYLIYMLDTH